MKKQKFMKLTAFTSEPELANSFTAPATHDGEVSVVFRGKDISIHGYDGSVWSTIYTWDGIDKQFTFNNTYQNYFLKSLTGSQETVGVSFFSISRYQGSTPSLAGIDRDVKLHDIDEVPIYTVSDVDKMLTIMSDGSLRWLLANESFIIPSEGGEGESGGSTPGTIIGLEENNDLTLHGNAQLIDGVLHFDGTTGTYASLPHSTDYDRGNGDLTISMWFKANSLPNNWNYGLVSKMGNGWQGYITAVTTMSGNTTGGLQTSTWTHSHNSPNARASLSEGIALGEWHHAAYVMVQTGQYKMYFNGQEVKSYNPAHRNTSTTGPLRIGGWQNGIYHGYFDGQIEGVRIEQTARSAAAILEEYTSGQGESSPSYLESSSTLYGDANFNAGTLVLDGTGDYAIIDDGFRFTDKMTTSVWFRTTATGDRRIYSSHVRSLGLNGFFARLANGQLKFRHPAGGAGELTGPSGLNDGQWHHMAVSWEASVGYTLYVDGAQISSGAAGVADGYIAGWGLYIGANPWNRAGQQPYGFFSGEIRNFEIENEVLTSQQVTDLYIAGAPPPPQPPSVSTGIESLGTNTLSGDAQQTAEGLLITNDGYADTQSNYHNGATEQTISAWFKASELGTVNGNGDPTWRDNGHMIALTRNWAAGGNRANGFVIAVASNAVRFGGPHGTNNVVKADYDFFVDTWYKIDLVWTANSMKLYVNGVEVGSTASSGTIAGGSVNMRIGRNINQWMSFKGNILGVEVENVARSSAEILTSYQSEV